MRLTNRLNLPMPIVKAIENSSYSPGESDITVTGLIEPVQLHALKEKHRNDLTEDASDLIYSLQGQSIHTILERAGEALGDERYVIERRFYAEYEGWKLGGQIDLYDAGTGLLQDYKVTSVYAVKDGVKEEYAKQLNINAELLRRNSLVVNKLEIVAILRDWSKGEYQRESAKAREAGFDCKYPSSQVVLLEVALVDPGMVESYIVDRIIEHREAKQAAAEGKALPECSAEERWARSDQWAVMKKGQKRAMKLFNSEAAAELYLEEVGASHVETRKGESIRCESYCSAKSFCQQYKGMKGTK